MATVGDHLYAQEVHTFFDGLGSYDAERACSVLAKDADMESPWHDGTLSGKAWIQSMFTALLEDPVNRPSFTIRDISGDGHLVHLDVRMSNRFGRAPVDLRMSILHLHDLIHHIVIKGRDRPVVLPHIDIPEPVAEPEPEPVAAEAAAAPAAEGQAVAVEAPSEGDAPAAEAPAAAAVDPEKAKILEQAKNTPEEKKAWVLAEDCIVCSGCDSACPTDAAITTDVARVDRDLCIADGACFDACPTDAIRPGVEDKAKSAGWPEGSRLAGQFGVTP